MNRVYPYPTRKVCPWIPEYQYPLVSIPESYPNILSMNIHTLLETLFFFFLNNNNWTSIRSEQPSKAKIPNPQCTNSSTIHSSHTYPQTHSSLSLFLSLSFFNFRAPPLSKQRKIKTLKPWKESLTFIKVIISNPCLTRLWLGSSSTGKAKMC